LIENQILHEQAEILATTQKRDQGKQKKNSEEEKET